MKKVLCFTMCVVMLLALSGCFFLDYGTCSACNALVSMDSKFCRECGVEFEADDNEQGKSEEELLFEKSRENIHLYLEVIPCKPNENGKIDLPSELHENKDSVTFLDMEGQISFQANKYGAVDEVVWKSYSSFTFDEKQAFAKDLDRFFAKEAIVKKDIVGQWNEVTYYWYDESEDCIITFYTSVRANYEDEKDRIELYWNCGNDLQ